MASYIAKVMSVDTKMAKVIVRVHSCSSSGSGSHSRSCSRSSRSSLIDDHGRVFDDELGVADRNRCFTCSRVGAVEAFDKTAVAIGVAQVAAPLGLYARRATLPARRRDVAQHSLGFGVGTRARARRKCGRSVRAEIGFASAAAEMGIGRWEGEKQRKMAICGFAITLTVWMMMGKSLRHWTGTDSAGCLVVWRRDSEEECRED